MPGHSQSTTEETPPLKGLFPAWSPSPDPGQVCRPSQYLPSYLTTRDDRWRKITRFQTSPPLGNIASKFRRSPAARLGSTQRVGRGLVDVMSQIHEHNVSRTVLA